MARISWLRTDGQSKEDAVAAAKAADVVIAAVGITADLEGEEMKVNVPGFSGGDRISIDLPKDEEDVLEAVRATGKPLIVVLMNGSALAVNWASQNANAILEAWYPGEEGGTAIAETLAGSEQSRGPSARNLLQEPGPGAAVYRLFDEEPDLSILHRASRCIRLDTG